MIAHNIIQSVIHRQRTLAALTGLLRGLVIGAAIAIAVDLTRRLTGGWSTPLYSLLPLVVAPALAAFIALRTPRTPEHAANAIDTACNLKDRAITSLELSALPEPSPVQTLALTEAQSHLAAVDPESVVPSTLPPGAWRYALSGILALAIISLPLSQTARTISVSPGVTQHIQAEAKKLAEELQHAQEQAREAKNPAIQKLAGDLKKLADDLKNSDATPREALLKLSEMQAAIRQEQAKFNTALAQQHLKSLGQALASTDTTREAGKALEEGKNQEAAKALDDKTQLPPSAEDRKKLADELKKTAEKMKADGLDEMANATDQLSQAAQNANAKDFSQGAKSLGKLTRDQSQRQKNQEWMDNQLSRLNEAKEQSTQSADAQQQPQDSAPGQTPGQGKGQGDQPPQAQADAEGEGNKSGEGDGNKSKPSSQWGTGKDNDPLGDPTKIAAKRQQEQLTGKLGETGDSESQTSSSPQGKDTAKASYKQVHERYQKLSESVLETEPLPPGQRQTIRKYFQSIRPEEPGQ